MRNIGYAISLTLICIASPSPARAEQAEPPKILITHDPQPVFAGQPFSLTVHIETSGRGDPEVRLPRFSGFSVLRQSESHPMSFHFSFGFGSGRSSQTKRESNYSYVLVTDRAGKYKLDPVTVTLDGKRYQSNPYVIEVLSPSGQASQPSAPGRRPGQVTPGQPMDPSVIPEAPQDEPKPAVDNSELDGARIDPDFFIQTHLDKKNAVVGEPLILTIYLYLAVSITDLEVIREPGTEGFWVENLLPGSRRLNTKPVIVQGREYDRAELRKVALFPLKPGKGSIAPTIVELEVSSGGFFSRRKSVKRASLPVTIEISELPRSNQPTGFDPANVGHYTFKADVDHPEVKVGDPVTLTMVVRGEGNLRNVILPTIPDIPGFKTYAPESEVDVQVQGEIVTGTRTSRMLLIPKEPGSYEIPAISWSHYDPAAEQYKVATSKAKTIKVLPRTDQKQTESASLEPTQTSIKGQDRLNRQLRSILSRADLETDQGTSFLLKAWFLILALSWPIAYLSVVLISRTRKKLKERENKGRSKRADAIALKRLAEQRKGGLNAQASDFFAELQKILTTFLEDRLEVPIAGDTMADLRARLTARGFSPAEAEEVITEMESCDFARFARSADKEDERQQALQRMEMLIRKLAKTRVVTPPKEQR